MSNTELDKKTKTILLLKYLHKSLSPLSEFMPLCDVFTRCCHDIVPVAKLLPCGLGTKDHLTHLPLDSIPGFIGHLHTDVHVSDAVRVHDACESLIEDGRGALMLSLSLEFPQDLVTNAHQDLGLGV